MQIKFLILTIFPESHRLAIIKQFSPIMAKNPQWIRNISFYVGLHIYIFINKYTTIGNFLLHWWLKEEVKINKHSLSLILN